MQSGAPRGAVHDVAVVGLGPVGATLANLLALRGLSVVVLEREAAVYALPRAIHFDGECMRVFQAAGIAAGLEPSLFPSPGMRFVDARGGLLIDWSRPQGTGPQAWNASYRFHQPQLEGTLRAALARRPNVDVRLLTEVLSIDQGSVQGAPARLNVARVDGGGAQAASIVEARYVVGCDGARSLVRTCMGVSLDDLRSHERWLVVDLVLTRERPDLGDYSLQFCDPARPATYVRGVGMRRRWELMLKPEEDAAEMTRPERLWELLSPWVTPEDGYLERPAVYTFHSVVAQRWRQGRLLIAGDAAHQTPPFMGQGMCAGIRDASNLAWKLAEVVHGRAPDSLLDSYETERAPHVREFIETAVRLGQVIQATDVEEAHRRDAQMLAKPQLFRTPEPTLGPGDHEAGRFGGRLSEQPFVEAAQAVQWRAACPAVPGLDLPALDATDTASIRLDDVAGYRHVLLLDARLVQSAEWQAQGLDAELARRDLLVVPAQHESAVAGYLQRLGTAALLVRPDRYIAGHADEATSLHALVCAHVPALGAAHCVSAAGAGVQA